MKLLKEYIDQLPTGLEWNPFDFVKKNIHWLNQSAKDVLLEDLIKIDFNSLYPNILVGLFNEGLLDIKFKQDIEKLQWFLERRGEIKRLSRDEYLKWRTFANSLYTKVKSPLVVEYLHLIYTDILKEHLEDIIYIDVDMIICKKDIDTSKIPTSSEKSEVEYFYIENLKKYIIFTDGQLETKGHGRFTKKDLLQLVKREIRTRRLDKLGI